ncbi:MAG: S-layer homology domain-containing protein [Bacillota bacterium]|nr:S-layer homology domain-containing protein [Bacillota bacterium]
MAAVINRAFGAEVKGDISNFNDVPNGAWFFDEMAKALHMKTFMGSNNNLNPNDAITRE